MDKLNKCKVLDFGSVYIYKKYSRLFEVKNNTSINQIFKIEQPSNKPRLSSGFNVLPAESPSVKPGEAFFFNVEFIPKVVNMKCCDYFIIKHLYDTEGTILTKASVKGPQCSLSCNKMKLMCAKDKKKCMKKFEIRNSGCCFINFQFIIDNAHSHVTIHPSHGRIEPSKNIYITATFTPTDHRPYFKRVFCLIENHVPFVVDIFAIWLINDTYSTLNIVNEDLPEYSTDYHRFMNDVMNAISKSELPLFTNNKPNIDFGHCLLKDTKYAEFTVTNNYCTKLLAYWHPADFGNVFKIQPVEAELDINSSTIFIATYKPLKKNVLYAARLEAQLFASNKLIPSSVEVNLKGHSFEEVSCGWTAQYKVEPSEVILPPCLCNPFQPSHSTLTIHRTGHLPLSYTFHPPNNTNFVIKPQQGLIDGAFQICVVQFFPKRLNEAVYVEKWILSFNSNENVNQCTLEIGGSIETPQLIINGGNDVIFPEVHPGTSYELVVDLYNPTRLSFRYNIKVLRGESVLVVDEAECKREIWPYEHKQVVWCFCPHNRGTLEAAVCYTPLMGPDITFKTTETSVTAICTETILKVVPHGISFQGVLRGCKDERGFEIINTGSAIIEGVLLWYPGENCEASDIEVNILPETFRLEPGSSTIIRLFVKPLKSGIRYIFIAYSTVEFNTKVFLPVTINCVFPHLQVTDIRLNNTGPLFTKFQFWKMLQINKLNQVLPNLELEGNQQILMQFPSYLSSSQTITIELLLENHSSIGVHIALTQKKACNCIPILTKVSFSQSRFQEDCPHKNQMQIKPMFADIKANGCVILELNVSYNTTGCVEFLFMLTLTPEDCEELCSTLELCFSRISIPDTIAFIDSTEPKEDGNVIFNMKPVFIGDCHPFVQGFNIYNNTKQNIHFSLRTEMLNNTPFTYIGEKNKIAPLTNHYLLFTFLPSRCETFEAETILTGNNEPRSLILRGTGLSSEKEKDDYEYSEVIDEKLPYVRPKPVYLSTSHVNIGPVQPSSIQRHVIFFNNNTKDYISFKWLVTKLPGVVELRVHPTKGAVQPGGVLECRLVSYCKGWPCYLTCTLSCCFVSFSKYISALLVHQKNKEALAISLEYFTITEEGIENCEPSPVKEEWPRRSYLTVSVTVDIRCDYNANNKEFLPIAPPQLQLVQIFKQPLSSTEKLKLLTIHLCEVILWNELNNMCKNDDTIKPHLERYIQLTDLTEQIQSEEAVPHQITQRILEEILYTAWQDTFTLIPRSSTECLRRTLSNVLCSRLGFKYNSTRMNSPDSTIIPNFKQLALQHSHFLA